MQGPHRLQDARPEDGATICTNIFPYQTATIMPPLRDLCAGRFAGIISVQNRKCKSK